MRAWFTGVADEAAKEAHAFLCARKRLVRLLLR